ncbi:hypothetical protein [Magnetococcus sp. PR-3]|uniref:hypothetical protein n=1 Tax=Magnetococcus sp. PR-3 TaxID=3120355 RepID=UPI002FCE438A
MQTPSMEQLKATITQQLQEQRLLGLKMAGHLVAQFNVEHPLDALDHETLAQLEEFELELLLSPLYTPDKEHCFACEPFFPEAGFTDAEQEELVKALLAQGIQGVGSFEDRTGPIDLPEIVLERYVTLLGAGRAIPEKLLTIINRVAQDDALFHARMLGRDRVWERPEALDLVCLCLEKSAEKDSFSSDKMAFLTNFIRTNRPRTLEVLLQQIINMVESYRLSEDGGSFDGVSKKHGSSGIRSQFTGAAVKARRLSMAQAVLSDFDVSSSYAKRQMEKKKILEDMENPFL